MVRLYISDAAGRSNSLLVAAVRRALLEFRGGGVPVDIFSTRPEYATIEYSVGFMSNANQEAAINQLKSLTVAVVNLTPAKAPLQRSLLFSLARSVPGLVVRDNAVLSPAGDLEFGALEAKVFRTTLDRVKVNGF